jgi:hypothetical protein
MEKLENLEIRHYNNKKIVIKSLTYGYVSFWVFPQRLRFKSRRFGTLYRFHLSRQVKEEFFLHLPRKMEPIEGSETSAFKPQTPGKYPKENILHNEHGESLKSRQLMDNFTSSISVMRRRNFKYLTFYKFVL